MITEGPEYERGLHAYLMTHADDLRAMLMAGADGIERLDVSRMNDRQASVARSVMFCQMRDLRDDLIGTISHITRLRRRIGARDKPENKPDTTGDTHEDRFRVPDR